MIGTPSPKGARVPSTDAGAGERPVGQILERYEDNGMGLPYPITLINIAERVVNPDTGEEIGISIPNLESVVAEVAAALCFMPQKLSGAEVRFIRRVLSMNGQELAEALGMDPATLSRWENGKQDIGCWADGSVRMAAILLLQANSNLAALHPEDVVTLKIGKRTSNPTIRVCRDGEKYWASLLVK